MKFRSALIVIALFFVHLQSHALYHVGAEWRFSDINYPSCEIARSRLSQVKMSQLEIREATKALTYILGWSSPSEMIEAFRRVHLPLDLNLVATRVIDLTPVEPNQATLASWQFTSTFLNWDYPLPSGQLPPKFLRVAETNNGGSIHIEIDLPLVQVCFMKNYGILRTQLQTGDSDLASFEFPEF